MTEPADRPCPFLKTVLLNLLYLLPFLLVACGQGGTASNGSGGGIGGTGMIASTGPITAFGSIFVNRVEYDTAGAVININGSPAAASGLAIGMVVQINGQLNADGLTGQAESITYTSNLTGPLEEIAVDGTSLWVLGQEVLLDGGTSLDQDLEAGNLIEVSGQVDGDGLLHATLVSRRALQIEQGEEFKLRGVISSSAPQTQTLTIGQQTIDYASATLEGLTPQDLIPGLEVDVSAAAPETQNAGPLIATEIEAYHQEQPEAGTRVEIEGFVTALDNNEEIEIDGRRVDISMARFNNGTPDQLAINLRVEIEGFSRGTVIEAATVEFKNGD